MVDVIDANELVKRFGSVVAVDQISLSVKKGEIFGFLGPNAAGKSTTIRLLSGILTVDGGNATILGCDLVSQVEAIKQRMGYVAQHFALYPELSVAENLEFYSRIYGHHERPAQHVVLEEYGLTDFAALPARSLSGGYKRRLSIACALTHDPELIFLDEPTAGIDPVSRKEIWDLFYTLSARGTTLFVTTHYMEEAERCHRLAFIHHGRLVAEGTPAEIKHTLNDVSVYACSMPYNPTVITALGNVAGVLILNQFGGELRIIAKKDISAATLTETLDGHGPPVLTAPTIEDAFMTLTRSAPPA